MSNRPKGSNADEWQLFLAEHANALPFLSVQIAEAIDEAAANTIDAAGEQDRMTQIATLIADLQAIRERFGNTCVYIRRHGLSWGAVALNYRDDDKKHGVFDLQAEHDRRLVAHHEQVERLKADRDYWMTRAGALEGGK